MKTFFTIALFPIQVGKSFCFKMAFRFLHRKNRNAAKRFGNPPPHKAPEDKVFYKIFSNLHI